MTGRSNLILAVLLLAQLVVIGVRFVGGDTSSAADHGLLLRDIAPERITRITVEGAPGSGEKVTVERAGLDAGWTLSAPVGFPADRSKIDDTLRTLAGLEVADIVSTSDLHHADLEVASSNFQRRVTLQAGDQAGDEGVTVLFGSSGPAGSTHARLADRDTVYAVRNFSSWSLSANSDAWMDRSYFSVPRSEILALGVENAHGAFRLERQTGGDWIVTTEAGAQEPANGEEVARLLGKLSSLTLSGIAGRVGEPGMAIDKPLATLVVSIGDMPAPSPNAVDSEPAAPPATIRETRRLLVGELPEQPGSHIMLHDRADFVAKVASFIVGPLLEADPAALVAR